MQGKKSQPQSNCGDIVFLSLSAPLVYLIGLLLLGILEILKLRHWFFAWNTYGLALLMVVVFDILWVAIAKSRKLNNATLQTRLIISLDAASLILPVAIYYVGVMALFAWEYRPYPACFAENAYGSSYLLIVAFDVLWVVLMKRWKLRKMRVKVALTLLVFVLSALLITDLFLQEMFRSMW